MPKVFGECCIELADAMRQPPNSFFRVEDNGVLYLTVGYIQMDQKFGFFDQAVLFCPFCGTELQTREEISRKSAH
jgi:hypothetical protein